MVVVLCSLVCNSILIEGAIPMNVNDAVKNVLVVSLH